ncbi:MAG: YqgE/AlgH family protein, partial [Gammaproteobacteria bacterium]|nr:YqgE/AlgH family protein [Gammaproteobacteria bacterium]
MTLPTVSLRNHLLIAMPYMKDAQFAGTVTYLCDHGEQGAMGLIINRPMDFSLGDILVQLDIEAPQCRQPVLQGGPVQPERGFVLHRPVGDWQSSLKISDRLALTTSRDVLEAIAEDE